MRKDKVWSEWDWGIVGVFLVMAFCAVLLTCGAGDVNIGSDTSVKGDQINSNVGSSTGDGDVGTGTGAGVVKAACDDAYINFDPGLSSVSIMCGGDTGGVWSAECDAGLVEGFFSCNDEWSKELDPCPSNSVPNTVTFVMKNCDLTDSVVLES